MNVNFIKRSLKKFNRATNKHYGHSQHQFNQRKDIQGQANNKINHRRAVKYTVKRTYFCGRINYNFVEQKYTSYACTYVLRQVVKLMTIIKKNINKPNHILEDKSNVEDELTKCFSLVIYFM